MEMQAKILTVLQNREITPVGSVENHSIDIRLVCATNKNILEQIAKGSFREDLFYRINTIHIEIPPLRNRGKDIFLLADYYLNYYKTKYGKPEQYLSANAKAKLLDYEWPGNVRELRHAIEKAVILNEDNQINEEDFYFSTTHEKQEGGEWPLKFEEIEKKAIIRSLANNNGKLVDAAKELGLTRQTLYNKLKKYDIQNS
jgi:transcriptional regulator with PAS, ATPase and Fis domain